MIQYRQGLPPSRQQLIYLGRRLDDGRSLCEYDVKEETTMHLVIGLRGGGCGSEPGSFSFADMSDSSHVHKVELSIKTPPGRSVSNGTNVKCKCRCTPDYHVICRMGYDAVEFGRTTLFCPNCDKSDNIVPVTVGFFECQYRFFGINEEPGEQFTSEWTEVAKEDAYQLFDSGKQSVWRRLIIESADIHDNDNCILCLDKLYAGAMESKCRHTYHAACADNWKDSCPNCEFNQPLVHVPYPASA